MKATSSSPIERCWFALRVLVAALAISGVALASNPPIVSAANPPPGGSTSEGPPPTVLCPSLCITQWLVDSYFYPSTCNRSIVWVFNTNIAAQATVQASKNPQLNGNGDFVAPADKYATQYAATYHNHHVVVPSGGKYYWRVKVTGDGTTITKIGEQNTAYCRARPAVELKP